MDEKNCCHKTKQRSEKEYKSLRKFLINIDTNRKARKAELCILGKKISFRKLLWGRK